MATTKVQVNGGVGLGGLLTILFIGLKLAGHIGWSWWWVLSPLWIPLAFLAGVGMAAGVVWATVWLAESRGRR